MKKKTNYFDFVNAVNGIIEKGRKQEALELYMSIPEQSGSSSILVKNKISTIDD